MCAPADLLHHLLHFSLLLIPLASLLRDGGQAPWPQCWSLVPTDQMDGLLRTFLPCYRRQLAAAVIKHVAQELGPEEPVRAQLSHTKVRVAEDEAPCQAPLRARGDPADMSRRVWGGCADLRAFAR